jgi:hypothetical protein
MKIATRRSSESSTRTDTAPATPFASTRSTTMRTVSFVRRRHALALHDGFEAPGL